MVVTSLVREEWSSMTDNYQIDSATAVNYRTTLDGVMPFSQPYNPIYDSRLVSRQVSIYHIDSWVAYKQRTECSKKKKLKKCKPIEKRVRKGHNESMV